MVFRLRPGSARRGLGNNAVSGKNPGGFKCPEKSQEFSRGFNIFAAFYRRGWVVPCMGNANGSPHQSHDPPGAGKQTMTRPPGTKHFQVISKQSPRFTRDVILIQVERYSSSFLFAHIAQKSSIITLKITRVQLQIELVSVRKAFVRTWVGAFLEQTVKISAPLLDTRRQIYRADPNQAVAKRYYIEATEVLPQPKQVRQRHFKQIAENYPVHSRMTDHEDVSFRRTPDDFLKRRHCPAADIEETFPVFRTETGRVQPPFFIFSRELPTHFILRQPVPFTQINFPQFRAGLHCNTPALGNDPCCFAASPKVTADNAVERPGSQFLPPPSGLSPADFTQRDIRPADVAPDSVGSSISMA
jgi:hypothetical protein